MTELYLLARIDGSRVAIRSDLVESVVNINDIVPVPRCNSAVAGLFALRSRVLTLIDSQYLVTGNVRAAKKGDLAIIAEIAGHNFGLLVDAVEDVAAISTDQTEDRIKSPEKWKYLTTQMVSHDGEIVMIIDPIKLVNAQPKMAA
jgi:purine-binding chemotaxis protein CheW